MVFLRAINVMEEKIIVRTVERQDLGDLYNWRNHPDVRKHCFNEEPILWDEHKAWFDAKIADKNTVIYVACFGEQKLGSLRFEKNNECIKVNVMLNPIFWGKGFGSKLIKIGTARFAAEHNPQLPVVAEVKIDNIKSLKSFEKAGFEAQYISYLFRDRKDK